MATTKKSTAVAAVLSLRTITKQLLHLSIAAWELIKQSNNKTMLATLSPTLLEDLLRSSQSKAKTSCFLDVKASILNANGGMHGGAVGAVAERVTVACARTDVGEDKDLFIGELGISYLSAAPRKTEVISGGHVVRSRSNVTVDFSFSYVGCHV